MRHDRRQVQLDRAGAGVERDIMALEEVDPQIAGLDGDAAVAVGLDRVEHAGQPEQVDRDVAAQRDDRAATGAAAAAAQSAAGGDRVLGIDRRRRIGPERDIALRDEREAVDRGQAAHRGAAARGELATARERDLVDRKIAGGDDRGVPGSVQLIDRDRAGEAVHHHIAARAERGRPDFAAVDLEIAVGRQDGDGGGVDQVAAGQIEVIGGDAAAAQDQVAVPGLQIDSVAQGRVHGERAVLQIGVGIAATGLQLADRQVAIQHVDRGACSRDLGERRRVVEIHIGAAAAEDLGRTGGARSALEIKVVVDAGVIVRAQHCVAGGALHHEVAGRTRELRLTQDRVPALRMERDVAARAGIAGGDAAAAAGEMHVAASFDAAGQVEGARARDMGAASAAIDTEGLEAADRGGHIDTRRAEQRVHVDRVRGTVHRAGKRADRAVAEQARDREVDVAIIFERGAAHVEGAPAGQGPGARPGAAGRQRAVQERAAAQPVVAGDIDSTDIDGAAARIEHDIAGAAARPAERNARAGDRERARADVHLPAGDVADRRDGEVPACAERGRQGQIALGVGDEDIQRDAARKGQRAKVDVAAGNRIGARRGDRARLDIGIRGQRDVRAGDGAEQQPAERPRIDIARCGDGDRRIVHGIDAQRRVAGGLDLDRARRGADAIVDDVRAGDRAGRRAERNVAARDQCLEAIAPDVVVAVQIKRADRDVAGAGDRDIVAGGDGTDVQVVRAAIESDIVAPELACIAAFGGDQDVAIGTDAAIGGQVSVDIQRDVAGAGIADEPQVLGIGEAERGAVIGGALQPLDLVLPVGRDAIAVERQQLDRQRTRRLGDLAGRIDHRPHGHDDIAGEVDRAVIVQLEIAGAHVTERAEADGARGHRRIVEIRPMPRRGYVQRAAADRIGAGDVDVPARDQRHGRAGAGSERAGDVEGTAGLEGQVAARAQPVDRADRVAAAEQQVAGRRPRNARGADERAGGLSGRAVGRGHAESARRDDVAGQADIRGADRDGAAPRREIAELADAIGAEQQADIARKGRGAERAADCGATTATGDAGAADEQIAVHGRAVQGDRAAGRRDRRIAVEVEVQLERPSPGDVVQRCRAGGAGVAQADHRRGDHAAAGHGQREVGRQRRADKGDAAGAVQPAGDVGRAHRQRNIDAGEVAEMGDDVVAGQLDIAAGGVDIEQVRLDRVGGDAADRQVHRAVPGGDPAGIEDIGAGGERDVAVLRGQAVDIVEAAAEQLDAPRRSDVEDVGGEQGAGVGDAARVRIEAELAAGMDGTPQRDVAGIAEEEVATGGDRTEPADRIGLLQVGAVRVDAQRLPGDRAAGLTDARGAVQRDAGSGGDVVGQIIGGRAGIGQFGAGTERADGADRIALVERERAMRGGRDRAAAHRARLPDIAVGRTDVDRPAIRRGDAGDGEGAGVDEGDVIARQDHVAAGVDLVGAAQIDIARCIHPEPAGIDPAARLADRAAGIQREGVVHVDIGGQRDGIQAGDPDIAVGAVQRAERGDVVGRAVQVDKAIAGGDQLVRGDRAGGLADEAAIRRAAERDGVAADIALDIQQGGEDRHVARRGGRAIDIAHIAGERDAGRRLGGDPAAVDRPARHRDRAALAGQDALVHPVLDRARDGEAAGIGEGELPPAEPAERSDMVGGGQVDIAAGEVQRQRAGGDVAAGEIVAIVDRDVVAAGVDRVDLQRHPVAQVEIRAGGDQADAADLVAAIVEHDIGAGGREGAGDDRSAGLLGDGAAVRDHLDDMAGRADVAEREIAGIAEAQVLAVRVQRRQRDVVAVQQADAVGRTRAARRLKLARADHPGAGLGEVPGGG